MSKLRLKSASSPLLRCPPPPSTLDPLLWREQQPMASFCLPIVALRNDLNGQALRYLSLTNHLDYTNPRVRSRPSHECLEICQAMIKFREDTKITVNKLHVIEQFRLELELHLTKSLSDMNGRRVNLEIYGSTRNGFGTENCDVDMSLSFDPNPPAWARFSADAVMREVAKVLVDFPQTLDERFIAAKVPIVRFRGVHMDMEADISYENRLALFNSSLLSHYCCWDPNRLPGVGVWIKAWAKRCGIGDASKGGLSSYAWIIMIIHYMQNCGTPPFLKRLQSEHYSPSQSQMVSGWNVYFWKFCNPHENLHQESTVYDLFVGFLEYYITFFRFRSHELIQIRQPQGSVPMRPERWHKYSLCIEDPFELDHNLAQGVDNEMFGYILSCLINSRSVFLDRSRRVGFLKSRGIVETTEMDQAMLRQYGEYLLHCCTLDREPPVRHFFRDRTFSQATNNSNDKRM